MTQLGETELHLLNEITQTINLGRSVEEIFDLVHARLRRIVPYDRVALALLDEGGENLQVIAVRSRGKALGAQGPVEALTGSDLASVLQDGRARVIHDLEEHARAAVRGEATRLSVREGVRSILTVPLRVRGAPLGVMILQSRIAHAWQPEHEEFLQGLVGHMAIAVEKSRLLEALRKKTQYLEDILQNSADAIVVTDADELIVSWNEGARRTFGYEAAEVVGKNANLLVPDDVRGSGEPERLKAHLRRDGFVRDHECVRRTKDGLRIVVDITCTALFDVEGRPSGCSCILRDVTNVKRLEEDLVRSRSLAALGELAAMVAHEIKNPLAGISGAVQVLIDAIPAGDSRRAIVGEILAQIDRLDRSVRDLLAFARPAVPARRPIELGEALWHAWSRLPETTPTAGVNFHLEAAGQVVVDADPDLLNEVWTNLFANAVEAMPAGGDLRARLTDGATVRVEIRDNGTGIAPTQFPRLFQPFHTTKMRGTGLGLAIARKIVEAHGGTIGIESVPGQGTTVIVQMPR